MPQDTEKMFNYNGVINEIDKAIIAISNGLEEMVYLRHLITAQQYGMSMKALTDIMLEKERISMDEVQIINRVAERKQTMLQYGL